MHHLRQHLTYANAMATIAVFIALGGGAYAAVSSIPGPDGVIHGCYKKRGGGLRLVSSAKKCTRSERLIAFNQSGPQGPRGSQGNKGSQGIRGGQGPAGVNGAAGLKGEQGPPGPGATTFTASPAMGSGAVTLATLDNGLSVVGTCGASSVIVGVKTTGGDSGFQASGTKNEVKTPTPETTPVDLSSGLGVEATGTTAADLDVLARDSTVGKFARIDVHGTAGSTCSLWGMVIPSG
jgi:hypothetical protein